MENQVKFVEKDGETQLQLDLTISNEISNPKLRNIFANLLLNDALNLGKELAVMSQDKIDALYEKLNTFPSVDEAPIEQDGEPTQKLIEA